MLAGKLHGHLQMKGKDSLGISYGQQCDGTQKSEKTLLLRAHWLERVMQPHPHSETGNSIFSVSFSEIELDPMAHSHKKLLV